MRIDRRTFLEASTALALAGGVTAWSAGIAAAQSPSATDLMAPGPLPEQVLGKADAPVTIVEYASMTCSHCATFHNTTFPTLKERYIDTGKVRFVFREFPLDPLAAAGFMLARCAGDGKFFPMVEALFHEQSKWLVQKPLEPLMAIAKQAGFTQQSFEQCLANQKLLDDIETIRSHAAQKLGVNSTPTFFINGKVFRGAMSIDDLDKQIQPYLKN